jgi:hypothetical protein
VLVFAISFDSRGKVAGQWNIRPLSSPEPR